MELCGNSSTFSFINIHDISWHSSIYSNREMLLLRGNIFQFHLKALFLALGRYFVTQLELFIS